MKDYISEFIDIIPAMLRDTHLTLELKEWPAAITVLAICGCGLGAYAIRMHRQSSVASQEVRP